MMDSLEGQAMELGWVRDNTCDISEKDYLRMVLKKTCWYSFIHPVRIGALIARPDQLDLDGFNEFGYFLSAAFQIQDDVLNLIGSSRERYGKEIGGDLYEGKHADAFTPLHTGLAGEKTEAP
jgi:geranylgeranyl diphosphate synthase type II